MTDRDRLAADLEKTMPNVAGYHRPLDWQNAARGLIALGWTRLGCEGCGDSITGEAWHYGCAATDIDEERLARALGTVIAERGGPIEWPDAAAAIAKAYREDTGP